MDESLMYPRLSWSTLQMFEECPERYLLHRQKKRAPIPERFVLVGSVLHYVAEQWKLRAKTHDEIVEAAERDFDRRVLEAYTLGWDAAERAEKRQQVTSGAYRLLELLNDGASARPVTSEVHLYEFYRGWALEGYIDLVIHDFPGRDEVWDIKTGSSHNVGQLQFYSVLYEAYFGRRPAKFGWLEPLGRGWVPITITDDEHTEMKQRIRDAVVAISSGEFPTSGFPKKCGFCPSRDFCPATANARAMKLG